jgi:hypothetical protein
MRERERERRESQEERMRGIWQEKRRCVENIRERDKGERNNKEIYAFVNSAMPHVALHCTQMEQKCIMHFGCLILWTGILSICLTILSKS